MQNDPQTSNLARALWVFLGYMLVGPFLAGLSVTVIMVFAPVFKLAALLPESLPPVGVAGLQTFVWAAIPAALTAVFLIPFVMKKGTFGWIEAGVAAVLAFSITTLFTHVPLREAFPFMAFLAGAVSVGVREALLSGKIIE